ncbi:hypothetical protein [Anabaena sp. CCY 9910]|uniref:hypothetical protein n=1 Tax=Anabaena sp. CCY 9910 TaxID=3103870 RepID=UPI0039E02C1D
MEWISRLRRWIKRLFRGKTKHRRTPRIIKRWDGKHCAVLQVERNTPAERATYRIASERGDCDYLLLLDNLRELQTELVGQFGGTTFKLSYIPNPRILHLTHRFSVWRVYRNGTSNPVGIWDCDLQGFSSYELPAQRATLGVALRCLKIIHSSKTPDSSWQSQCDRMNWLGLLEEKIKGELGVNHNLKACDLMPRT